MQPSPAGKRVDASAWVASAHVELVEGLGLRELAEAEYYECRLGAGGDQVDYLVAFARGTAGALGRRLGKLVGAGASPAWAQVLAFVDSWSDGRSAISTHVPTVWLEFDDVSRLNSGLSLPSLSACLVPAYRTDQVLGETNAERALGLAREVLARLGDASTLGSDALLGTCFRALPRGGRWIHVSVMVGRKPRALKLYGSLPRQSALAYLRGLGFAGQPSVLQALFDGEYGVDISGDEVLVDLNLANCRDASSCTLGLAVGQQHFIRGSERDAARSRALSRWVDVGLCSAGKAALARDWVRGSEPARDRFLDLKLVWHARDGVQAKAYLGIHPGEVASSERDSRSKGGS